MIDKPKNPARSAAAKRRWERERADAPTPDLRRVKAAEKRYRAARAKSEAALEARDEAVLEVLEAGEDRSGLIALLAKTLGLDKTIIRRISAKRERKIRDVEREP